MWRIAVLSLLLPMAAPQGGGGILDGAAPPVVNCVYLVTNPGIVQRCRGEIPAGSAFGPPEHCTYVDEATGERKTGTNRDAIEIPPGYPPGFTSQEILGWGQWLLTQDKRFPEGFRVFKEYCDDHFIRRFSVSILEPLFDPFPRIVYLEQHLPIPEVELITVPDQSVWGGLVVNVHTALGVRGASWKPLESPTENLLGTPLKVVAIPRTLEFTAAGVAIPCVGTYTNSASESQMFPPEPTGFRDQTIDPPDAPLPSQPCVFTPRAPGTVTVTATVTYTIAAIYGPGVILRPDFVRTVTVNLPVVELKVVNTKP